ncbi:MAG: peptidoglycan-binding protein [Myxococcaceae bacterium]|nr:peptidoglycan-binding protein [Myxococcaceae bacterium]
MKVLTHRVLPKEAKKAKAELAAITSRIKSGDALNLGDTGKAVTALQTQLKAAGLFKGPVGDTFDAATASAVANLQRANQLESSGIVGGRTLAALKKTNLFVKDGFQTNAKVGQSGSDILRAERMLEKLGFRPGKVDGIFDAATAKAVERYRDADPQLPNDKKFISQGMFKELKKASAGYDHAAYSRRVKGGLKAHQRLDDLTARTAAKGSGIGVGAEGRTALNIEKHLEAAGYELGKPNARFGSRTEAAVKAFQKHAGLEPTGRVDARTWSKLRGKLFAATSDVSPAQRLGENDAAVKRTEKKLKQLGYKVGDVDGLFTQNTAAAVRRFQKKHGIKQTGQVGSGTAKAIDKALTKKLGGAAVQKMLSTARKWLGFHERGNNGNPFSSHFGRPAEAWCADFVSYLADKAGLKLNTASAQGVANILQDQGTWKGKRNPRPGDAVTFRWDGSGGWADHVGIVEKVFRKNGKLYVQTIEGNSGDAVRRKVYPAFSSVINGYGRIK